uniref:Uncharacterized protein n=1 Tax=Aegilops tauschii subsp. strangulata TaxID=200361 RepID=A0A453DCJ2_AEGTS
EFFACCESYLAEDGILVLQVHLSSRGTVRAIQKKARLHKRIHIPWRLPSFFGPYNVCHDHVIKVLHRACREYWTQLLHNSDALEGQLHGQQRVEVLALGFDERFLRIWEYYLIFSA